MSIDITSTNPLCVSFESGNDEELAEAMYEVLTNSQLRESMIRNANEYVARQSWERHKSGYLQLVDALIARAVRFETKHKAGLTVGARDDLHITARPAASMNELIEESLNASEPLGREPAIPGLRSGGRSDVIPAATDLRF